MNIGLIDVDGHNWPNLALMKLSAWHKAQGDTVEWWDGFAHYDRIYMSRVFDDTYSADEPEPCNADEIIKGGTGYGLDNRLQDEIEHMCPDYSLYSITDTAYGFLTRGCPRGCSFCIVAGKEGRKSKKATDLSEFWSGQKIIKLLDPNLLACPDHLDLLEQLADSGAWVDFTQGLDVRLVTQENVDVINRCRTKMLHFAWDNPKDDLAGTFAKVGELLRIKDRRRREVYVLTNYGSTLDEDLYRIYTLRGLGFDPYVMIYDKPNAPKEIRDLQRWCNNRIIFGAEPDFKKYKPRRA